MRVLVFHGYLLHGTGSNVYNANLAAALVGLGHEVELVCQERSAPTLDFVGAVGDWDSGELEVERVGAPACTVYRPNIGGLLPVYVLDDYEGVQARLFADLTDAELEGYIEANVEAVAEIVARARPDVALANHLVMGPAILARALAGTGVPYAVVVHGSALEYTVKPHPRFVPYAQEGVRPAKCVLAGSSFTAESMWAALPDPELRAKTRLGPPGVDVGRFRPVEREQAIAQLREVADGLRHEALAQIAAIPPGDQLVSFVGKLIISKGIDLLLLAWPLVLAAVPTARLAVVGFGAYADAAKRMTASLARGDLGDVSALVAGGRQAEGGEAAALPFATAFIEGLETSGRRERYLKHARAMAERVVFTGRLDHAELPGVLALCEAMVVPSTFPEAFGMVTIEAAASGVLPISAGHSGLAEVTEALAGAVPEQYRELLSFPLDDAAVESIAQRVVGWLQAPPGVRAGTRAALAETASRRFSWEAVAQGVIAAARGELDLLEVPG